MKTRGFTLIELMIVIAVIGIVVAIIAPLFSKNVSMPHPPRQVENEKLIAPTPVPATPASAPR